MNLFLKKILLAISISFTLLPLYAQVNFSATISPSQIFKNETATLRIIIENGSDIEQITPPSFKDFIVVGGPNQESGMSAVNGVVKQYIALSYILKPRNPGRINLSGAVAKIGGKNYTSNGVRLIVNNEESNNSSANTNKPLDPFAESRPSVDINDIVLKKTDRVPDKVNKNMQLRVDVNKTNCYVGQPVVASYKLYTRLKSESKLIKSPSFNGFSVIDVLPADVNNFTNETLNGKEYNVYTIRKAQLYPLQAGNIEIESIELENNIEFIKEEYARQVYNNQNNFFSDIAPLLTPPDAYINQKITLVSKPVYINVKPLPDAGKPANFKGAVGNFSIHAELEKVNFNRNEPGKLLLTISGNGNLQMLTPPEIKWPEGVEPFEPKATDEIIKTTLPISGKKIFEYPFTVKRAGDYNLHPITFNYFDPSIEKYKTAVTQPICFAVSNENTSLQSINSTNSKQKTFIDTLLSRPILLINIGALLGLVVLFVGIRKKNTQKKTPRGIIPGENLNSFEDKNLSSVISLQNPLAASEKCLFTPGCDGFYAILNREMKACLSTKLSLLPEEINYQNITRQMDNKNIPVYNILLTQQVLQDIEWHLFTPVEKNENMNELYRRAQEVLQNLEQVIKPKS